MANQTVSVNRNMDDAAIAGLLNGEDVTVNSGAVLTINSDSRWGQQAAVIGNITIDSGTGGTVRIDGRDVWWMAFDAGTGTIPALGTLGVQNCTGGTSGATGEFLGIWTQLGVAPSSGAMPATGFIKFRSKVGDFLDNEVVTLPGGATITVNSATGGQRGWIHVVGEQAQTITVPRLGLFEALGDWFELGLTNGADNQIFQFPVSDYCTGLLIETAPSSGVYEWWPSVGLTRWGQNNRVATDVRGKVIASQSNGTVVIAQRGAVNTGYRPPSGCRVRIPNIMVSSSTSTNWTLNLLSASTTSWDFTTTGAGAVRLDKTIGNWYLNFSQAYSLEIVDSAIQGDLTISECATAPIVRRCGVGIATNEDRNPLTISSCFAGGTIEDCVTFKYENESGDVGWSISDCDGFTISGCKTLNCGDNTAATLTRGSTGIYNVTLTRITNTTITNHANIGGGFSLVACSDVTITNYTYADCLENRTTNSTNGVDACVMQGGTNRCMLDGFANYGALADVHPYNNICSFSACYDCEVRNIGTSAAPYNCGSVNACGNAVSFAGNDQRNIARRVYAQNTRTGPVATVNSSSGGQAINVWGDYADAVALAALDFAYRGGRMAGSVTGQTSVYGTHWSDHFTAATTGLIRLHANEPTSSSALECSITAGTPRFTSTGQVKLTTVGDQVTWTMPYFAIGHTSLATLTFTGTNQANHNLEFQVDTGAGFGAWQTLDNANLAAVGAIDPTTGVRLKIRATCTVAATTNAITYITVNTVTNATDQQIQYPLPGGTLTISSVVAGSRVSVIRESDSSYLANVYPSGTEVVVEYPVAAPFDVTILILKQGRLPFKLSAFNLAGGEQAVQSVQPIDRTFNNP